MTFFWILLLLLATFIAVISTGEYGMVLIFVLLGVIFIATLTGIIRQFSSMRSEASQRDSISLLKLTAKFALLFLTSGTFLYILVFQTIGHEAYEDVFFSNTEIFFRSLFCSFDLFFLNIDSNIIDRIDNHPDLKTWIFIQAILSAITTAIMFLSLVISRLRELWKLNFKTKIKGDRSHLYLFFGLNKPTELLAQEIRRNDSEAIVILIDYANISDDNSTGFDNILSFIGHRSSSFSFAKKLDAVITVASSNPADLEIDQPDTDVFKILDIPKVRNLISRLSKGNLESPQLHLFFLGEDEEQNVKAILNVAKDSTIKELKDVKPIMYCHARKSGSYSFLEQIELDKNIDIRIIDSSYLAVENLKLEERFHPVNLVKLSEKNPASVSSSFQALVIGFGEVGRDALRFLYEFGAFPAEDSSAQNSYRSPFKCVVTDSRMESLEGGFLQSAPALAKPDCGVSFINFDANDARFVETVLTEDFCRDLNYVVVATGDDEENINLGIRLFQKCWEAGNDMQSLRILIRCVDDSKLHINQKIANFYNSSLQPGKINDIISIFGMSESVFTYDLIIRERLENDAKAFFASYQRQSNGKLTWAQRHDKLTSSPLSLLKLQELRRKEGQDFENALHAATKINILERSLGQDYDYQSFLDRYFKSDGEADQTGSGDDIKYPRLTKDENHIILNLAMLEHLRWIASHELLGYLPAPSSMVSCDERRRLHPCLIPWQELDYLSKSTAQPDWTPDYKIYDFYVVDTTIYLNQWRWKPFIHLDI